MSAIANLFFYVAISAFMVGVLLNPAYLIKLPFEIPARTRWPVLVWIIMLVGLGQWFGRDASSIGVTTVDSSATFQIASIGISGMIMLMVAGKSFVSKNFKFPFIMLFIFAFFGILTAPISDVPMLSVFKASSLVVAILLAVMAIKPLMLESSPRLVFNTVYIYFVLLSFLAVLGGVLAPEITHRPNDGIFGFMLEGWPSLNSNSLSYVAAVAFVVSLRRIFIKDIMRKRMLYVGACSVGAVTLLMAQGRTSIISSTLAILFMSFFIREMRSLRYIVLLGIIGMFVLIILSGSIGDWTGTVQQYMQRGVTEEKIATLSGRTDAWAHSWGLFLESPIMGYGFYAAGKTLLAPHNSYFTILLNGGLLGFLPWLIGIIGGMWMISRHFLDIDWRLDSNDNNFYKELLAVLIVQFVRTITGQDLTIHSYSMLAFLGIIIYVVVRENSIRINIPDNSKEDTKTETIVSELYPSVRLRKN